MEVTVKTTLTDAGIAVDEAMSRLMNNENLYLRVLKKFVDDDSYDRLVEGVNAKDATATFEGAHALKGVASNLGMEALLKELHPIVETSRVGSMEGVEEQLPRVTEMYQKALTAISTLE